MGMVKQALGAAYSKPQEGNKQSNFAILASSVGLAENEEKGDAVAEGGDVYYQVDVQVCVDREELEGFAFYQSYGGVGVLLGLLFRRIGLSFGLSGLRLPNPLPTQPPITFYLTSSMMDALTFAGLSIELWQEGFSTQRALFDWIASSTIFDAHELASFDLTKSGAKRAWKELPLCRAFLLYIQERAQPLAASSEPPYPRKDWSVAQDEALRHFNKKDEHAAILRAASVRQHVKTVFNGSLVEQWTQVHGVPVRWIMDEVKKVLGTHAQPLEAQISSTHLSSPERPTYAGGAAPLESWEVGIASMGLDEVQQLVLQARDTLQAENRLTFDWRAAKARKDEEKKMKREANHS